MKNSKTLEKIQSKKFSVPGSQVLYTRIYYWSGSLSADDRREIKLKLARCLSVAMGNGADLRNDYPICADSILGIRSDCLGRPTLEIQSSGDFSISFSYGFNDVWGAICNGNLSCGIDVAFPQEFSLPYPYQKAFKSCELDLLMARHNITLSQAACLAWSAKESLVKSLGIGFNLCEPLDLFVIDSQSCGKDLLIKFAFSSGLRSRLGIEESFRCETITERQGDVFLSLSVVSRSESVAWRQTPVLVSHRIAKRSQ